MFQLVGINTRSVDFAGTEKETVWVISVFISMSNGLALFRHIMSRNCGLLADLQKI